HETRDASGESFSATPRRSPAAPLTRDVCATYIDRGRAKLEENEEVKVTRLLFGRECRGGGGSWPCLGLCRRPTAGWGGLGVGPTRRHRIGALSQAQGIARMLRASVRRHRIRLGGDRFGYTTGAFWSEASSPRNDRSHDGAAGLPAGLQSGDHSGK